MAFAIMHYNGVNRMRLPLTAFEAFAEDSRNPVPGGVEREERAQAWLTIASAAEALGSLRGRKRSEFLMEFDDSVLPPVGVRPSIVHDVAPAPESGLSQVAERIRVAAEEMERGGFLNLAYTTVSALCRVMVREDLPTRLMTTMHLGRIARQLSDIPVAIDCYRSVALTGLRERDGPAAARGFVGLGLVAFMKGNLPLVRDMFERALLHAYPGGLVQGHAHMALSNVARRQRRFDEAFAHGWRAHDLLVDVEERVGILGNISAIALETGYARAALKGYVHAISLSASPLRTVGVFADAIEAAGQLEDQVALEGFEREGLERARTLQQPFEIARVSLSAANAWIRLGNTTRARALLEDAKSLAERFGFHELHARSESLSERLAAHGEAVAQDNSPQEWIESTDFSVGIARLEALGV